MAATAGELAGIVESAAGGDTVAFGRIVAAYDDEMYRVCMAVGRDPVIAADAVQSAWSIAWRKLGTLREPERLRPWLVSVAVNQVKELLKQRQRRSGVEVPLEEAERPGAIDPATGIAGLDLRTALERLDPDDRALLAMRYVAGFKASELGTGRSYQPGRGRSEVRFSYGVTGDLFAEMTSDFLSGDPKVPATYHWAWDGEQLAFEVWGKDLGSSRSFAYGENTWVPVGDPRTVVIAVSGIEAGDRILGRMVQLGIVSAAEVGADVLTDRDDVAGSIAAVPISKGQPITPAMLDDAVPTGG